MLMLVSEKMFSDARLWDLEALSSLWVQRWCTAWNSGLLHEREQEHEREEEIYLQKSVENVLLAMLSFIKIG